jgi:hypothetical protein
VDAACGVRVAERRGGNAVVTRGDNAVVTGGSGWWATPLEQRHNRRNWCFAGCSFEEIKAAHSYVSADGELRAVVTSGEDAVGTKGGVERGVRVSAGEILLTTGNNGSKSQNPLLKEGA